MNRIPKLEPQPKMSHQTLPLRQPGRGWSNKETVHNRHLTMKFWILRTTRCTQKRWLPQLRLLQLPPLLTQQLLFKQNPCIKVKKEKRRRVREEKEKVDLVPLHLLWYKKARTRYTWVDIIATL